MTVSRTDSDLHAKFVVRIFLDTHALDVPLAIVVSIATTVTEATAMEIARRFFSATARLNMRICKYENVLMIRNT